MPTRVRTPILFNKNLKRLARKYPKVLSVVEALVEELKNDARPGDQIPNVGYEVYKVRLENLSANRGKSGGFRVIYYLQLADSVILLTIYSKTEQSDISPDQIRRVIDIVITDEAESDDL